MDLEIARLDRLNTVGELASVISHEVRNPLTTVKGFLQILQGKEDCTKYLSFFEIMIDELDQANSIITEFLSMGQRIVSPMEKGNINTIIETLFPLIHADALGQDKIVRISLSDVPDLVLSNKEIRQMILNLCRNGLEAMSKGGELIIQTYVEKDRIVLAVTDQGNGIKPEILEKLGTPFLTTKQNGTGLGVGICYKIAEKHNAKVEVDTGPSGTTFYVRFEHSFPVPE